MTERTIPAITACLFALLLIYAGCDNGEDNGTGGGADSDGDLIPDNVEGSEDVDGDGIPDYLNNEDGKDADGELDGTMDHRRRHLHWM